MDGVVKHNSVCSSSSPLTGISKRGGRLQNLMPASAVEGVSAGQVLFAAWASSRHRSRRHGGMVGLLLCIDHGVAR